MYACTHILQSDDVGMLAVPEQNLNLLRGVCVGLVNHLSITEQPIRNYRQGDQEFLGPFTMGLPTDIFHMLYTISRDKIGK